MASDLVGRRVAVLFASPIPAALAVDLVGLPRDFPPLASPQGPFED
jgi:hypothetical protein